MPSRTTIERIGKALGLAATAAAVSIERYLRPGEKVPQEAVGISVGLDRTSVPYEEVREEGSAPKTRRKTRQKPYQRQAPDPVDVNYRMDYVGTVSIVDSDAATLFAVKYFATHDQGPEGIVKRMMSDIRSAQRQRSALDVSVVQDGAKELWNLIRTALKEQLGIEDQKEAVDRYHLSERLGKVLKVTLSDEAKRSKKLAKWEKQLDKDDGAIDQIARYIKKQVARLGEDAPESLIDRSGCSVPQSSRSPTQPAVRDDGITSLVRRAIGDQEIPEAIPVATTASSCQAVEKTGSTEARPVSSWTGGKVSQRLA